MSNDIGSERISGSNPEVKHICLFYSSEKDLLDMIVPFFRTSLEKNELCVWVVSDALGIDKAKSELSKAVKYLDRYFKKGQIEIIPHKDFYGDKDNFNPYKVLQTGLEKGKKVLESGFDGLRVSGDSSSLDKKDWKKLMEYEKTVNESIKDHKIMALCTYVRHEHDLGDTFHVGLHHPFAYTYKDGQWNIFRGDKILDGIFE